VTAKGTFFVLLLLASGATALAGEEDQASLDAIRRRQRAEWISFYRQGSEKAALPQNSISLEFYNQAVGYFKSRDYGLAREVLKDALAQDGRNTLAYELLGDIEYIEGDLDEALAQYKKAFQIQSRQSVKTKLEKILSDVQETKDFSTDQDKLFILKYPETCELKEINKLKMILHDQYKKLSQDFGFYFKQPLVVVVYSPQQFEKVTKLPHWVSGTYDGNVRIPFCSSGIQEEDTRAATLHEMTHAFVTGMSQGQAPAWIQEGVAVYQDAQVKKREGIVFRAAVKTGTLLPLDQLMNEKKIHFEKDPLLVTLFYEESYEFVGYLVRRFGWVKIKEVLTEYTKGKNSDEVIQAVYSLSPEILEKAWKDTLTN